MSCVIKKDQPEAHGETSPALVPLGTGNTTSRANSTGNWSPKRIDSDFKKFKLAAEINSLHDVEKQQEKLSVMKAHIPLGRLIFLGCLAGWWLGLASILAVSVAGGVPLDTQKSWPMLPKIINGLLFPVGICFISLFGGELFTGNSMCMLIGLWAKRITIWALLYNWFVVLVSNFVGSVTTVYFFGYLTQLFKDDPWNSYVIGITNTKINLPPQVAFLRAIAANALVCTCILLGMSAKDMIGKLAAMWFPIMTFCAIGYEHAIANMAYIPLGLMYGASADYKHWLYQNLLLVILGNIVGGGFIIGGAGFFLYNWTKVLIQAEFQHVALTQTPAPEAQQTVAKSSVSVCVVSEDEEEGQNHHPHRGNRYQHAGHEQIEAVFRIFDADKDGRIVGMEIMCALNALDISYPKPLIEAIVRAQVLSPPGLLSEQSTTSEAAAAADLDTFVGVVRRIQVMDLLGLGQF